jgi:hypothetical protein
MATVYFKVLLLYLPGETEKNHRKHQSAQSVSRTIFKLRTPLMPSKNTKSSAVTFVLMKDLNTLPISKCSSFKRSMLTHSTALKARLP